MCFCRRAWSAPPLIYPTLSIIDEQEKAGFKHIKVNVTRSPKEFVACTLKMLDRDTQQEVYSQEMNFYGVPSTNTFETGQFLDIPVETSKSYSLYAVVKATEDQNLLLSSNYIDFEGPAILLTFDGLVPEQETVNAFSVKLTYGCVPIADYFQIEAFPTFASGYKKLMEADATNGIQTTQATFLIPKELTTTGDDVVIKASLEGDNNTRTSVLIPKEVFYP